MKTITGFGLPLSRMSETNETQQLRQRIKMMSQRSTLETFGTEFQLANSTEAVIKPLLRLI